jgi:hypothetical protein
MFCSLRSRCLTACSFLLLVTSERQAALCALLSSLFRSCDHVSFPLRVACFCWALYSIKSVSYTCAGYLEYRFSNVTLLRLIERAFLIKQTTGTYHQCGSFCVYALNTHLFS